TALPISLFYENQKFSNFSTMRSGKMSISRREITGAISLYNIYQTSTIGQDQMFNTVKIPPKIWSILGDDFYLDVTVIKRDPCLTDGCMLVVKLEKGTEETIKISGEITKVINQDQDSNKNNISLRKKKVGLYDTEQSYHEQISRIELLSAFHNLRTPLNKSKIEFS